MTWEHHLAVAAALFVVGASLGSFLNVCLHRIPAGLSVLRPASRCPRCGSTIAPRDNLPILGWLLLRGRCRGCREPISIRYPLVEFVCGALPACAYLVDAAVSASDPLESGVGIWMLRTAVESTTAIGATALLLAFHDRNRARTAVVRDGGAA